ncbi:MAG: hypothetical protein CVT59_05695 [Actinobacteria bacterium HGW-Actinobacteria-1]|nr:MAG: hypothetical protein CVT59_05695 [Actinobacteria bacterium HGW-Actinobacteria-1]
MDVTTRPLTEQDLPRVAELLDSTLGAGFWDLDVQQSGSHRAAVADGIIVGVASAVIAEATGELAGLAAPVGLVRIAAVAEDARGCGVATRLVREVCDACAAAGAADLAAFAWVHGPEGSAPLAGVLRRLGFTRARRLVDFYSSSGMQCCPACGQVPCACPADLYVRSDAKSADPHPR